MISVAGQVLDPQEACAVFAARSMAVVQTAWIAVMARIANRAVAWAVAWAVFDSEEHCPQGLPSIYPTGHHHCSEEETWAVVAAGHATY